jgi:hypothetical protein
VFAANPARIEDLDFEAALSRLEERAEMLEAQTLKCVECGAEERLPAHHFAARCAFCAAVIVSKGYARRDLRPGSMIPFQVDRARAQQAFRGWVRRLWLVPREFRRYAYSDAAMTGIYLPFWAYGCRASTDYAGERGVEYYVDEGYMSTNSAGQAVDAPRRVLYTDWSSVTGHVESSHEDVLVSASATMAPWVGRAASNWHLKALVAYQPEYVSGYFAEAYQVGLRAAFSLARERIDAEVRSAIRRDIGADRQRVHWFDSRYSDVRFKHVLLPVWMSAYRFRGKAYRFIVNGQTGEVSGDSPVSWHKVTGLALGAIAAILFAFVLFRG